MPLDSTDTSMSFPSLYMMANSPTRNDQWTQPGLHGQLVVAGSDSVRALGSPVLADDPTGVALGDPEPIDERESCSPTTVRG